MLILTRKIDDEIVINSDIRIKILSISENQIKIGITAPPEIVILRGEIYDKVKQITVDASKQSRQNIKNLSELKVNKIRDSHE
jgi:carbon storage regulator